MKIGFQIKSSTRKKITETEEADSAEDNREIIKSISENQIRSAVEKPKSGAAPDNSLDSS